MPTERTARDEIAAALFNKSYSDIGSFDDIRSEFRAICEARADTALEALSESGYSVERLEQVGWVQSDGRVTDKPTTINTSEPVFRVLDSGEITPQEGPQQ